MRMCGAKKGGPRQRSLPVGLLHSLGELPRGVLDAGGRRGIRRGLRGLPGRNAEKRQARPRESGVRLSICIRNSSSVSSAPARGVSLSGSRGTPNNVSTPPRRTCERESRVRTFVRSGSRSAGISDDSPRGANATGISRLFVEDTGSHAFTLQTSLADDFLRHFSPGSTVACRVNLGDLFSCEGHRAAADSWFSSFGSMRLRAPLVML